jgi:hypothetical protein
MVMRISTRLFVACAIASLFAGGLSAIEVAPFTIPSARLAALGGTHAALTDDFSSLFTNPAGFAGVKKELSVAELSISLYGPIFEIADLAGNSGDSLDLSGIVGTSGINAGVDIGGPLAIGWVGHGLGFGFFNRSTTDAVATGSGVRAVAAEDFLVVGGYAFRFEPKSGHIVDAGFLGKGFLRGALDLESSLLSVAEMFSDNPFDKRPFMSIAGIGLDLGVRYEYDRTLAAAIVCRDVYSPALITEYASASDFFSGSKATDSGTSGKINPRLDIGVAYYPRYDWIERYVTNLVLLFDYRDILDLFELIPRNPILNFAIGAEVVVLDALSLRLGIADALPCMGFGLDLRFARLDFAMRGVELGLDPGVNPVLAMDLGLLFRY